MQIELKTIHKMINYQHIILFNRSSAQALSVTLVVKDNLIYHFSIGVCMEVETILWDNNNPLIWYKLTKITNK